MWRNVKCSDLNCIKYSGLISHIVCKIKWNLRIWLEHIYAAGSWCLGKLKMFSSHSEISDFQSNSGKTECKRANTMISKDAPNRKLSLKYSPIFSLRVWGQGWWGWAGCCLIYMLAILTLHYSSILLSDTAAHHTQWPSRSAALLPGCYS